MGRKGEPITGSEWVNPSSVAGNSPRTAASNNLKLVLDVVRGCGILGGVGQTPETPETKGRCWVKFDRKINQNEVIVLCMECLNNPEVNVVTEKCCNTVYCQHVRQCLVCGRGLPRDIPPAPFSDGLKLTPVQKNKEGKWVECTKAKSVFFQVTATEEVFEDFPYIVVFLTEEEFGYRFSLYLPKGVIL